MKKLIYILPFLLLMACESPVIEKIEETYPDNAKKKVSYFQEQDDKEVLIQEKYYHQNGKLKMSGKFLNGKREGEWNAFFDTDQIQSLGTFKNGLSNGETKVYYPNGNLRYEGFYQDHKQVGHWKFYTEQGKLDQEKDF